MRSHTDRDFDEAVDALDELFDDWLSLAGQDLIENNQDAERIHKRVTEVLGKYKKMKVSDIKTQYLAASHLCPVCKSRDIESGRSSSSFNNDEITQDVLCEMCGARWVGVYTLSDMRDLDVATAPRRADER